ncbi:NRDE family protein [Piscinibacter gummiphilus]|uniref:NRDE family protein n=1 Tax=Piscinibacter gummiphilus TaxID=946333 RepID=A0ABZ0D0V4_9BURK|nr:NRDE family protein [Piscinibacter gummiphilus]WOB10808.1 NRDE family protein [Piscinibacter gummiphilus]
MCLVAIALDQSRRFPLVIAANRDEFFQRPAARLAWWSPGAGQPDILGGRDLEAGGTWLGLTAKGRLALITNVRDPANRDPNAPSRGSIVTRWLNGDLSADRFWMHTALSGYNGFNLVAADFRRGECFFASSQDSNPMRLERGLYGLSNASLDTPWPKVTQLKERVRESVDGAESLDMLAVELFDAMNDRTPAPDEQLPMTGVPHELEKALSPAFIRTPDGAYGTRSTTLVITERVNKRLVTHVLERTYSPTGGMALLRRSSLKDWPPRYTEEASEVPAAQGVVTESEETTAEPARKTRVRSLLKPEGSRRRRAPAPSV